VNRKNEVMVGLVILAGIAVAAVGTLWLKGTNFGSPDLPVVVLVQDVGQLREGNAVKFRGVRIGRVHRIAVVDGGEAVRLDLRLEELVDLPDDVGAIVAAESLFGEWQVELVSRSRFPRFEYFEVAAESRAEEGGAPVVGGYAIPDISRLTAAADEISENLAVLTDRVDRTFTDSTAANLAAAINNIQGISENLRDLVGQQASTFEDVGAEVRRAATEIGTAAEAGRSVLERTDDLLASGDLDSILVNVRVASQRLGEVSTNVAAATDGLAGTLVRADSTFARIDLLSGRVVRGEGALGQLFADTVLVGRASEVLRELDLLLADFRANPKRYVRLSIF
jgi:phospholipid/cholesterol/gamma-HCH transport system substrate-binding protein